jgi:hypothetical protein
MPRTLVLVDMIVSGAAVFALSPPATAVAAGTASSSKD